MAHVINFPTKGLISSIAKVAPLRFCQIGVAVTNITQSCAFFRKIGFVNVVAPPTASGAVLQNKGGLELHLMLADKPHADGKNILMDYPDRKPPGHTHCCFVVPSIAATQAYFESAGIALSGTRQGGPMEGGDKTVALFVRDCDRTTFEFEIHGEEDTAAPVSQDTIGATQCMDHVGIRVSTVANSWKWYADNLGFNNEVTRYEVNPNPLKNFAPWISRTATNVDINFIPNANFVPEANALLAGGTVVPGIVFVSVSVSDLDSTEAHLKEVGAAVVRDDQLAQSPLEWAVLAGKLPVPAEGRSLFVMDADRNIMRLVQA